jgi:hypothetical protein
MIKLAKEKICALTVYKEKMVSRETQICKGKRITKNKRHVI